MWVVFLENNLSGESWMSVKSCGNEVENPSNGASTDKPKYSNENTESVFFNNPLDYTINCPHNVKEGKAEDDFCDFWQFVNGFD